MFEIITLLFSRLGLVMFVVAILADAYAAYYYLLRTKNIDCSVGETPLGYKCISLATYAVVMIPTCNIVLITSFLLYHVFCNFVLMRLSKHAVDTWQSRACLDRTLLVLDSCCHGSARSFRSFCRAQRHKALSRMSRRTLDYLLLLFDFNTRLSSIDGPNIVSHTLSVRVAVYTEPNSLQERLL